MIIVRNRKQSACRNHYLFAVCFALTISLSCAPLFNRAAFDLERIDTAALRVNIEKNFSRLRILSGRARITYEMPTFAYSGIAEVAMRLPDSVKVTMRAIFGMEVGSFFTDGKAFKLYVPMEKTLYSGEIGSMELTQFFQIDVGFKQLLATFTGAMLPPDSELTVLGVEGDDLKLHAGSELGNLILWIEPKYKLVHKAEIIDFEGEALYRFQFNRFQKSRNVVLPKMISVEQPQRNERLSLYYTSRTLNDEVVDLDLLLTVPDDVEEIIL